MIKKYNKLWLKIQYLIVLFEKKMFIRGWTFKQRVWKSMDPFEKKKKRRFFKIFV